MSARRVAHKALSLALIFCLGAPPSSFALRAPNAEDSPPLRKALAAGLEEEEGDATPQFRPLSPLEVFRQTRKSQGDLDLKEYSRKFFRQWRQRVVEGKDKRALFLVLWKEPVYNHGPQQQPIRRAPFLEDVVYETAAALGVNAAEVLIPTAAERAGLAKKYLAGEWVKPEDISLRRLVSSYTPEESKGFEQDPKRAFTRALLVLGILARVWDLHPGNMRIIPGTEVPLFFDFEEGLNPYFNSMRRYTRAFLLNYFHPDYSEGPALRERLLERMDWREWRAALRDVERMDFEALREEVKRGVASASYGGRMPQRTSGLIDSYFKLLIAHQRTIRPDGKAFWRQAAAQLSRGKDPRTPGGPDRLKAEAERILARIVSTAEAEVRLGSRTDGGLPGKQVVIVDGALLHLPQTVRLIQALGKSGLFLGRMIVWGEDHLPGNLRLPEGLRHARTQEELEGLLLDLARDRLEAVTYIGPYGRDVAEAVDAVIRQIQREIAFTRSGDPALLAILAGLGISQQLLSRFATDPEFAPVLDVQM